MSQCEADDWEAPDGSVQQNRTTGGAGEDSLDEAKELRQWRRVRESGRDHL